MGIAEHRAAGLHALRITIVRSRAQAGKEIAHQRDQRRRLLHAGNMACAGDHLIPGAGNERGHGGDEVGRRRAVLIAHDAQGRHGNAAGLLGQIGVADGGAGGRIALAALAGEHHAIAGIIWIVGAPEGRREPAFHHRIKEAGEAVLCDGGDAGVPALGRADLRRGVAEDEGAHKIRPCSGERLRDHAPTERPQMAAARGRVHPSVRQDRRHGSRWSRGPCRVRQTMTALVIEQDRMARRKGARHGIPDAEIRAERIGKDEHRRTLAGTGELIVKRDVFMVMNGTGSSSVLNFVV